MVFGDRSCGWVLFAVLGLGAAGCSEVKEVTIADVSFESLYVVATPNPGKDSVSLSVTLVFDRPEDDRCYQLSPGTRASAGDLALPTSSLGGIIQVDDWRFPDTCIDGVGFDHPDVPLSTTPTDTTIRIEDESGHVEMTIRNLLVKRQVSFIEPADGVLRPSTWVRMLWTPESDPVDTFGVSFVSKPVEVHAVETNDTSDFQDGKVKFFTSIAFQNLKTNTYFDPGTTLEGSLKFDVSLEPTVLSCSIEGTCWTRFPVTATTPAVLIQE